jgi:hypothetical protein
MVNYRKDVKALTDGVYTFVEWNDKFVYKADKTLNYLKYESYCESLSVNYAVRKLGYDDEY